LKLVWYGMVWYGMGWYVCLFLKYGNNISVIKRARGTIGPSG